MSGHHWTDEHIKQLDVINIGDESYILYASYDEAGRLYDVSINPARLKADLIKYEKLLRGL